MTVTQSTLTLLGIGLGAIVAFMLLILTQAKKVLDSDKDYAEKLGVVENKNLNAAMVRLQWIGRDLTDPKSNYASHTLNIEAFAYDKTLYVMRCFNRVRTCRAAFGYARLFCEIAKWTSMLGVVMVLFTAAALIRDWERALTPLGAIGAFVVGVAILSFAAAEGCLQAVRQLHIKSLDVDAELSS